MPPTIIEPKPGVNVGRVVVSVLVENAEDRRRADAGELPPEQVRRVTVEALVDSGATFFCLPASTIRALGLHFHRARETRTISGPMALNLDFCHISASCCAAQVLQQREA